MLDRRFFEFEYISNGHQRKVAGAVRPHRHQWRGKKVWDSNRIVLISVPSRDKLLFFTPPLVARIIGLLLLRLEYSDRVG